MLHRRGASHPTFCARCHTSAGFAVFAHAGRSSLIGPPMPCAFADQSSVCLHFGSELYSLLPFPFLAFFRGTCRCLRFSSSWKRLFPPGFPVNREQIRENLTISRGSSASIAMKRSQHITKQGITGKSDCQTSYLLLLFCRGNVHRRGGIEPRSACVASDSSLRYLAVEI
jgi:hypothetical protein